MIKMRRALASLLLALFTVPVMVPILRATSAPSVRACCRLNGAHQCSMASTQESPSDSIRAKCAYYASAVGVPFASNVAMRNGSRAVFASLLRQPAAPTRTVARRRVAFSRSRQKRGPPHLS